MKQLEDQVPLITEEQISKNERLPLWRKICFGFGGPPYQITNTVINFFLSIFLLEVAQIRPSYVSIIVFGGKAWDAITDPICGYLVNRTNTRFGKLRPWILLSAPFACTAYFFLWYVPDFSEEGKLAWYFCFYCLFQGLLSGIHVPYTSLTMYISNNQKERDSATVYRMLFEAIGVLVAAVVQGQFVNEYRIADCKGETTVSPDQLDKQKLSYIHGSILVISIYVVCAVICFLGTKEKEGVVEARKDGFLKGIRTVISFGPYVKLSISFMFLSLAIAIVQGNLALYCTHSLGLGDYFSSFIIVNLVSAIGAMPFWQVVLLKYGKKKAFAAGMILFIPILLSQLYIQDNIFVYYFLLVLAGFSISVALLLPWSMLPDVLDEFMLVTGERKDAIFYSFYVFFNKFASGVGLGLSQLALQFGGYDSGKCQQPASVGLALRLLVVPGPVVFILIALVCLAYYPIDETRRKRNKDEIAYRSKQKERRQNEQKAIREQNSLSNTYPIASSVSYESIYSTSTKV